MARILMMFSTMYTSGSLHSADAATLTLLLSDRLLEDLQQVQLILLRA